MSAQENYGPHDGHWIMSYKSVDNPEQILALLIERGTVRGQGFGLDVLGEIDTDGDRVTGVVNITLREEGWTLATHEETEIGKPQEMYVDLKVIGEICEGYATPNEGGGRIDVVGQRIVAAGAMTAEAA